MSHRHPLSPRPLIWWLLTALPYASPAAAQGIVLSSAGKTDYAIVLPKDAIPAEKHAAAELGSFLNQIGGATFPVQDDTVPLPGKAILLGNNAFLAELGVRPDWDALGKEGFRLQTSGPHLVIAGGRPRGTLYGVYAFLEEKLGCRWYTSKISKIPRRGRIVVGDLEETQVPALEYREPFNTDGFDPDWAARNRCNSSHAALTEEYGGKITTFPFVHSFYRLIPPPVYFKDHPDWFSQQGGKRTADHTQLCLTNPDVVAEMVRKVEEVIRTHPDVSIVSVSQNDWRGNCRCARCKALDEAEGSPSGSLLTFVNAVAEQIGKKYPDVAIDTLAYQYTRKPPKTVRPLPNVIVRLCSIECDFGHPLATGRRNRSFAADLRGWHRLCNRLYIWDYITSFSHYLVPFPDLHTLGPNLRFFVRNGVRGVFAEGNYGPGGGGASNELRNYLLAKLMWNPAVDENAVRADFLAGVYGPAAPFVDEYLRLLQHEVESRDLAVPCWFGPGATLFTTAVVTQAQALFDKAEAAVTGNPELLLRVRKARLPIDYVVLCQSAGKSQRTWRLTEERFGPQVSPLVTAANRRFFATATAIGLNNLHEGGQSDKPKQVAEFRNRVRLALGGVPIRWITGSRFSVAVAPGLGCRVLAVRETDTKRDRLTFATGTARAAGAPVYQETFFPRRDGEVPFVRNAQPDAYTAGLPNGFRLRRSVTPLPTGFQVMTQVTNEGRDQPLQATARLLLPVGAEVQATGAFGKRSIPSPAPGAPANLVLSPTDLAGQPVTIASGGETVARVALHGPTAGLSLGLGPSGRLGVGISFVVPTLKAKASTRWTVTVSLPPKQKTSPPASPGIVEAQEDSLSYYQEGRLSGRRFDPSASDGALSFIVGATHEWALQWRYSTALFEPGRKYTIWAAVRVLASGTVSGQGLTCGVYAVPDKTAKASAALPGEACRPGVWQWLKVGTIVPAPGDYVWFAPTANPTVTQVQVDRILMAP